MQRRRHVQLSIVAWVVHAAMTSHDAMCCSFGMQHDGEANDCHSLPGQYQLLMQAQLNAQAAPMIWSECSRKAITKFLESVTQMFTSLLRFLVKNSFLFGMTCFSLSFCNSLYAKNIQTDVFTLYLCTVCYMYVYSRYSVLVCSRDWGFCLDDEATNHELEFDERPPGVIYDADHQCRLQYGEDAAHCDVDVRVGNLMASNTWLCVAFCKIQ